MPEERKPVENPVLVDAMATFKLDLTNREHEIAFLKAAVEARYLLPAQVQPDPDAKPDEDGKTRARIAFQIMTNQKGEQFMPVFTDEVELKKARNFQPGERVQIAVMTFQDIFNFIKSNEPIRGVVINPSGSALCLIRQQVIAIAENDFDIDKLMERAAAAAAARAQQQAINMVGPEAQQQREMERAAQQQAFQQDAIRQAMAKMEADKAAAEAAPDADDVIPDDLLDQIKAVLKKQKTVKKAYIHPEVENGEQYLLIALEADESADIESISAQIAKDCSDYSDLPFDCVAASSIRAKELVANEKPFYEKKRFGFF